MTKSIRLLMVTLVCTACTIRLESPAPMAPQDATWSNRIAEIVRRRCVPCHSSGHFAAVQPLETYAHALLHTEHLPSRLTEPEFGTRMPPYPGGELPGRCEPAAPYSNDLRLSNDELAAVLTWLDNGLPMGDGPAAMETLAPAAPTTLRGATEYPLTEGYVISVDAETAHKDDWICLIVDPGQRDGRRFLSGMQVDADRKQAFRGAVLWLDRDRASLRFVAPSSPRVHGASWYDCDTGFGFTGDILGGFLPEQEPFVTPPGSAIEVPGDALLVLRIHYHAHYEPDPSGEAVTPSLQEWQDHTTVRLRWEEEASVQTVATVLTFGGESAAVVEGTGSLTPPFAVPPTSSEDVARETMVTVVPGSSTDAYAVFAVQVEMMSAGHLATLSAGSAGEASCLAAFPKWNPTWQAPVTFDTAGASAPVVYGGQTLRLDCDYRNPTGRTLVLGEESCRAMVGLLPLGP